MHTCSKKPLIHIFLYIRMHLLNHPWNFHVTILFLSLVLSTSPQPAVITVIVSIDLHFNFFVLHCFLNPMSFLPKFITKCFGMVSQWPKKSQSLNENIFISTFLSKFFCYENCKRGKAGKYFYLGKFLLFIYIVIYY